MIQRNANDPARDRNGSSSCSLADNLRFIAVADYVLAGNTQSFRSKLSEVAHIKERLFERSDRGDPIDGSYLTMLSYKELFDALAAGDMDGARRLAGHMGGRRDLEQEHDHPFDYAMGYTLRAFVLGDLRQVSDWVARFFSACKEKKMPDFTGYGQVFQGILSGDGFLVADGMKNLEKGHRKQSTGSGVFVNSEDELLCVWGIGIANLARSYGVRVAGICPLIPDDLLIAASASAK